MTDTRIDRRTDLAWVTCNTLPEPDTDEAPTLAALRAAGLTVETLPWEGAQDDAQHYRLCLLRSCWNYYTAPDSFARWVEYAARVSTLRNGVGVARWNLHKGYLHRLRALGVPVVPTRALPRSSVSVSLAALAERDGWSEVVIKPAISAGSFATRRFAAGDPSGQAFLTERLAERDMLVQEFVPAVETSGEKSLVWIDGRFTHAVIKQARFADDEESVSEALELTPDEERLGTTALRVAQADGGFDADELLYARVDTVECHGRRVIAELELLEPSLYLRQSTPALERFVAAIVDRLAKLTR